ncbi:MAG: TIGR04290 family methyltransferase [Acidobacteria bacterium]|nr:TIGR04290 family methyltransferase [Acidobacteriota bacterium]
MSSHGFTQEMIRARVRELGDWFHNMNLEGVETAPDHFLGDYPAVKWKAFSHVIPKDLSGKSVLDVGCNAGFYSIEMKRRGADRVVGIDPDPAYLAQARFASEVCGVSIDFRRLSVYEVQRLKEKFDLILFLGVFYHLRYPLLALDLLREHVVKDMLVFQSLQRGSIQIEVLHDDYPFAEEAVFERAGFPRMFFVEKSYSHDPTNWWIPNRSCVEALLRSASFEILAHVEKDIYVCRKAPGSKPVLPYPFRSAE